MSKPNYCPNCGASLEGEDAAEGLYDDRSGDGGYDAACASCGWPGDIMPDDEQGKYREETGAGSQEPLGGRLP